MEKKKIKQKKQKKTKKNKKNKKKTKKKKLSNKLNYHRCFLLSLYLICVKGHQYSMTRTAFLSLEAVSHRILSLRSCFTIPERIPNLEN